MICAKVLLAVLYLNQRQNVFGQPHCCPENVTLNSNLYYVCENAEPPLIRCDKIPFRIPNNFYTIQNDTEGEYLDIGYTGVIVRSP